MLSTNKKKTNEKMSRKPLSGPKFACIFPKTLRQLCFSIL